MPDLEVAERPTPRVVVVRPAVQRTSVGGTGAPGPPGRDLELRAGVTDLEWRLLGDAAWHPLVALADLEGPAGADGVDGAAGAPGAPGADGSDGQDGSDGADGRSVQVRRTATHLEWRLVGDVAWQTLVPLADITGPAGADGTDGTPGADGLDGVDGAAGAPGADGTDGVDGRSVELRKTATEVQWRWVGDPGWLTLTTLAAITGPAGAPGAPGAPGVDGTDGLDGAPGAPGADGLDGLDGADGAAGADGREVQLRATATDVEWRLVGDAVWLEVVPLAAITGPAGADGADGAQGLPGADGADGAPGLPGADGADGAPGAPGADGADGADGRSVELRTTATEVQWRLIGDAVWQTVTTLAAITGPQGIQGTQGIQGVQGPQGDPVTIAAADAGTVIGGTSSARTIGRRKASIVANVSANNTAADTPGVTLTIPANTLVAGTFLRFRLAAVVTNPTATANTLTGWVKLGATKVGAIAITMTANAKTAAWDYEAMVAIRTIGAAGTAADTAHVFSDSPATTTTKMGGGQVATAVNTTADLDVSVGVTWTTAQVGAVAAIQQATVEVI